MRSKSVQSQLVAGRISTYPYTYASPARGQRSRTSFADRRKVGRVGPQGRRSQEGRVDGQCGTCCRAGAGGSCVPRSDAEPARAVVDAALRASPDSLPAWVSADLGSQGTAVVKVLRIIPREGADAQQAAQQRQQLQQWWMNSRRVFFTTKCSKSVSRFKSNLTGPSLPVFDDLKLTLKRVQEFGCGKFMSTVAVAQLVESRIVIPVVVGSSPISHPKICCFTKM